MQLVRQNSKKGPYAITSNLNKNNVSWADLHRIQPGTKTRVSQKAIRIHLTGTSSKDESHPDRFQGNLTLNETINERAWELELKTRPNPINSIIRAINHYGLNVAICIYGESEVKHAQRNRS
jgi:hypothetical protein